MSRPTKKHVTDWLTMVMARVQKQGTQEEADKTALFFAPAFIAKYQAADLDQNSLNAVGGAVKYFNQANVEEALDAHLATRRATEAGARALPPEAARAPVGDEAKQWLAFYYGAMDDATSIRRLDLIRSQSAQAFGYLTSVDSFAASVAVRRGWYVPTQTNLAAEWDDEEGIRRLVQSIVTQGREGSVREVRPIEGFRSIGQALVLKSTGMVVLGALIQAVKVNAPQHAWVVVDELKYIKNGEPVDVAFPAPPAVVIGKGMFE